MSGRYGKMPDQEISVKSTPWKPSKNGVAEATQLQQSKNGPPVNTTSISGPNVLTKVRDDLEQNKFATEQLRKDQLTSELRTTTAASKKRVEDLTRDLMLADARMQQRVHDKVGVDSEILSISTSVLQKIKVDADVNAQLMRELREFDDTKEATIVLDEGLKKLDTEFQKYETLESAQAKDIEIAKNLQAAILTEEEEIDASSAELNQGLSSAFNESLSPQCELEKQKACKKYIPQVPSGLVAQWATVKWMEVLETFLVVVQNHLCPEEESTWDLGEWILFNDNDVEIGARAMLKKYAAPFCEKHKTSLTTFHVSGEDIDNFVHAMSGDKRTKGFVQHYHGERPTSVNKCYYYKVYAAIFQLLQVQRKMKETAILRGTTVPKPEFLDVAKYSLIPLYDKDRLYGHMAGMFEMHREILQQKCMNSKKRTDSASAPDVSAANPTTSMPMEPAAGGAVLLQTGTELEEVIPAIRVEEPVVESSDDEPESENETPYATPVQRTRTVTKSLNDQMTRRAATVQRPLPASKTTADESPVSVRTKDIKSPATPAPFSKPASRVAATTGKKNGRYGQK